MAYKVLIVGAGQLGSRYLQGLAKCTIPLSISVCDISPESIAVAESRWLEVGGDKTSHSLKMFTNFDEIPGEIDLAIISTNALVRPGAVQAVAARSQVKNWLLEKTLAQSEQQLALIRSAIGTQSKAWVNTPYRAMTWYHKIRAEMTINGNFFCELKGGKTFGLASNAIHYLDLLVWLSRETIAEIKTDGLDNNWFKSKRAGFWDIFGSLEIIFSKGSKAFIRGETYEPSKTFITIQSGNEEWDIQASNGVAIRNKELVIEGREEYQSEITAPIVESILLTGKSLLPTFEESAATHIPMLNSLLDHWNSNMPEKLTEVPIT